MSLFKRVHTSSTSLATPVLIDHLALYEQYSPLAYNVILHIISEPDVAQTVLIELFSSLSLRSYTEVPTAGEIIRLARTKALAARPASAGSTLAASSIPTTNDTMTTAKIVFNLAFCQGYSREAIADQLNVSPANVLNALHTYFKELRSS